MNATLLSPRRILLASHGTPGARAAEEAALALAEEAAAAIVLLYVVPDFWRGMRGDDWLNNVVTQQAFGDYLENELLREARKEVRRVAGEAERRGIAMEIRAMFGRPDACLLSAVAETNPDLVMIGAPRPKGVPGYRSRMKPESLMRALPCPLIVVPNPLTSQKNP